MHPVWLAILGAFFLSLGGVFLQPLRGIVGSLPISGYRGLFVFLALSLLWLIEQRNRSKLWVRPSPWQLVGAAALGANAILFVSAVQFAGTAIGYLLCNAAPVYMVLYLYIFEQKRPAATQLVCIFAVVSGMLLFFIRDIHSLEPLGIVAGILGGLTFTLFLYAQTRVPLADNGRKRTPILGAFITPVLVAPILLGGHLTGIAEGRFWTPVAPTTLSAVGLIAGLSLLQYTASLWLWGKAQQRSVSPVVMAFMPTLTAVWAPVWSRLAVGERLPTNIAEVTGAVLVHLGVVGAIVHQQRKAKPTH